MTISELMEMFIEPYEQHITLFDVEKGNVFYSGTYEELPEEYQYLEIASIDNLYETSVLALNVILDEEE